MRYVEIYIDKNTKTQRLVFCGNDDCTSVIEKALREANIAFTNHKFVGRAIPERDFKQQTFAYAKNYKWLNNVSIENGKVV